jgi:SAM-dependent methyltransferase|tara:strand:- start:99 stop:587 length:489 start_codon:yes stop_codon:yes gene_type:complete
MKNSNLNLSKLKTRNVNYRKYLIKNTKLSISEITRLSYDLQSGDYIKNYKILKRNKKNYKIFQKNMKELNERINFKKIKTILDFGTGEGTKLPYILKFNKNVKKIYACDISFNRLRYANDFLKKNLNKKEISKLSIFCNKDFELPFKSNSIDIVFTNGVLKI